MSSHWLNVSSEFSSCESLHSGQVVWGSHNCPMVYSEKYRVAGSFFFQGQIRPWTNLLVLNTENA